MSDDPTLELVVGPERDLPVAWDGVPVEWSPWQTTLMFICPPAKNRPAPCPTCGDRTQQPTSRGVRRIASTGCGRLGVLVAFRCPGCRLDTVWEPGTDQTWTLDDSDYGPDGSTEP